MAISQGQIAGIAGGASVGLGSAELTRHAVERGLISNTAGWAVVTTSAAASLGYVGAGALGMVDLNPSLAPILGGAGVASPLWYTARDFGLAPRLTVDVPDRINLAGPLATTLAISVVGLGAGTLAGLAL